LYRDLELVMAQHGIARRPETPPLAHANALVSLQHPLADEVLEFTEIYLAVRFGGASLSEQLSTQYRHRLRALKDRKTAAAA